MLQPAIKLTNVVKTFGTHTVLDSFSLCVEPGEMIAIQGRSGTGKSTVLNILGLLDSFDKGSYELFGEKDIRPNSHHAQKAIRKDIGYLFQNFALADTETVEKNLSMALHAVKGSAAQKRDAMSDALAKVGLEGFLKRKVCELSGGEQQRVALARCMVKPGRLLLADEPTGSLDGLTRDGVLDLIKRINHDGKTVVVVTHDTAVAQACNRVVTL